jgi:phosphoglycolate phosphatase-like HAD superfamily hydrolase
VDDDTGTTGRSTDGPLLVLWDIDRTLVVIGGEISREVWARALTRVTGLAPRVLPDMAGRTDRAIAADALGLLGVPWSEQRFGELVAALTEAAGENADRVREFGTVLPAARETVAELAARQAVQTVVTGNIRPIARLKLTAADLTAHLDLAVGGYGEDGSDRADLVRLARQRATAAYGFDFAGRRTVVVGDTPHDVRGAHDAGALAVAVATGRSTTAELARAGADIVLDDLTQYTAKWASYGGR